MSEQNLMESQMEADSDARVGYEALTGEAMNEVGQLAAEAVAVDQEIARLEILLEAERKRYALLVEKTLPETLARFGLSTLGLTNGRSIEIEEHVFCGITKENQQDAHKWLAENKFGDIIKREVKLPFAKGADKEYGELIDLVKKHGFSYSAQESVHASTLKAWVKRELAKGTNIPVDLFSIFKKKIAKIL